jgi:hypothetical protein
MLSAPLPLPEYRARVGVSLSCGMMGLVLNRMSDQLKAFNID